MGKWQLQEAKACLSEVVRKAVKEGLQEISVRGQSAVVVISSKKYYSLKEPKSSFVRFMRSSPPYGLELDLRREQTLARKGGDFTS